MRSLARSIGIVLVSSAVATAAEPDERGLFDVRVTARPAFGYSSSGSATHFALSPGVSFQVSPKLSLRPTVGLGVGGSGNVFHAGGLAFYNLRKGSWSPYIGGGFAYAHRDGMLGVSAGAPPPPGSIGRDTATFLAGAGVEWRLGRRLGLFVELGQAYTPGERYRWSGTEWHRLSGWTADVPFRSGVGLTVNLK